MIPELGNLALCIALAVTLLQAILPLVGAARGIPAWITFAHPAARVQALLVIFAFICLCLLIFVQKGQLSFRVLFAGNMRRFFVGKSKAMQQVGDATD